MRGSPKKAFEKGLYLQILESLESKARLNAEEAEALIGSYAFLGRLDEAFSLWGLKEATLPAAHKIRCRFYLGIAATRTFRFEIGHALFETNLKARSARAGTACYAYQGMGFYFYFIGQFSSAKEWAAKALAAATEAREPYLRFLATDLLGHATVQLGRRSEGLRLIRVARDLAARHGNGNFAAAFTTASLIYEAEAGWKCETITGELEETLAHLGATDSYTRGNLILEIARQWVLRGRWNPARELLNREASSIYAFGNRRQELMLQLRLAEVTFRQGDRFAAEHFIQAARRCLHEISDRIFEIRILGLEIKMAEASSGQAPPLLVEKVLRLSGEYPSQINQQMLFRKTWAEDPGTSEAEDPVHHLFQLAQREPERAGTEALNSGYLSLWLQFSGLASGTRTFSVLEDGQSFVMSAPEGIHYRKKVLSTQSIKLLKALSTGVINKESLLNKIWGYRYSPLQHDPLIYSAMTKLRKSLEPWGHWIVTTDEGWALAPTVEWHLRHSAAAPASESPEQVPETHEELNFRQLRVLGSHPKADLWSIAAYKEAFSVSTMTAFRDLDGLRELNFLVRTGKGRATRYHLPGTAKRSLI